MTRAGTPVIPLDFVYRSYGPHEPEEVSLSYSFTVSSTTRIFEYYSTLLVTDPFLRRPSYQRILQMDTRRIVELQSAEAALWVWNTLWSTNRHARMDIIDVAIFKQPSAGNGPEVPSIARWLFTAKDGRVLKKASNTASVATLKESFLGRILDRAIGIDSSLNAVPSDKGGGQPFAIALLGNGESVLVNEDAWKTLFPPPKKETDVIALSALAPVHSLESGHAHRQRLACEYRIKTKKLSESSAQVGIAASHQARMTTYVLLSPSRLRGVEKGEKKIRDESLVDFTTTSNEKLLLSRVNHANREVESKLRRIVRWVEEVRRVHVLCITAIFTVYSASSGNGAPGAWLERVTSLSMIQHMRRANEEHAINQHSTPLIPNALGETSKDAANDKNQGEASIAFAQVHDKSSACRQITEVHGEGEREKDCPYSETALETTVSATLPEANDSVPSETLGGYRHPIENEERWHSPATLTPTHKASGYQGRLNVRYTARRRAPAPADCAGNFCAYEKSLPGSLHRKVPLGVEVVDNKEESIIPWTDGNSSLSSVDASLETAQQPMRTSSNEDHSSVRFSFDSGSVATAHVEATTGQNSHWDKGLLESWDGEKHPAVDDKHLPLPRTNENKVLLCRSCHNAYSWLNELRQRADQGASGLAESSLSGYPVHATGDHLTGASATAASVEGGRIPRERFAAMLKHTNPRKHGLGIDTGAIWRRKLSMVRSGGRGAHLLRERHQLELIDRLARPKRRTERASEPSPSAGPRRRVRSQGDASIFGRMRQNRHVSAPPRLLPVVCRSTKTHGRRLGAPDPLKPTYDEALAALEGFCQGEQTRIRAACEVDTDDRISAEMTFRDRYSAKKSFPQQMTSAVTAFDARPEVDGCRTEEQRLLSRSTDADSSSSDVLRRDRSRMSILAIQSMLADVSESYLPARVRDLPEATEILGPALPSLSPASSPDHLGYCGEQARMKGQNNCIPFTSVVQDESLRSNHRALNPHERDQRRHLSVQRLLHPWQRKLEAIRNAPDRVAQYQAQVDEQRRLRKGACDAATMSQECQKARQRVAARLGRQRHRRRSRPADTAVDKGNHIEHVEQNPKSPDQPVDSGGCDATYLGQMADSLRWARKTFDALVRRSHEAGLIFVGESTTSKDDPESMQTRMLADDLQTRLVGFEEEIDLIEEAMARAEGRGLSTTLRSRCEAACSSFESDFHKMIRNLSAKVREQIKPRDFDSSHEGIARNQEECKSQGDCKLSPKAGMRVSAAFGAPGQAKTFADEAARSLVKVREMIPPPVVPPILNAKKEVPDPAIGPVREAEPPHQGVENTHADEKNDREENQALGNKTMGQECLEDTPLSSGDDTDDDGVMWSPLNIAKLRVQSTEEEPKSISVLLPARACNTDGTSDESDGDCGGRVSVFHDADEYSVTRPEKGCFVPRSYTTA